MAVIVVHDLQSIVKATSKALYGDEAVIGYIPGDASQIIAMLKDKPQEQRFPCVIVQMPYDERAGGEFLAVSLKRIIIATRTDSTNPVLQRYNETFLPVLYPIYEELLNQISRYPLIAEFHPDRMQYNKQDIPGSVPAAADMKDYLDTIELYNLQLDFLR